MKVQTESRGRWEWVVDATPRPFYPLE
jgi:hypothetical protein